MKEDKYLQAINVIAGPHLCKIAVQSPAIASEILKKRLIFGMTRLLPLSRLRIWGFSKSNGQESNTNDVMVLSKAKSLVREMPNAQVYLPFQLINYEEKFSKLIKFVFQNYLVVSSMEVGQVICDRMRIRCVTLEGEKIEMGMLTGGYRSQNRNMLKICEDFNRVKRGLRKVKRELEEEEAGEELRGEKRVRLRRLEGQHGLVRNKVKDVKGQVRSCLERMSPGQEERLGTEITQIEEKLGGLEETLKMKKAGLKAVKEKLEAGQSLAEQRREQVEMLEQTRQQVQQLERRFEELDLEKTRLAETILSNGDEKEAVELKMRDLETELGNMEAMVRDDETRLGIELGKIELVRRSIEDSEKERKELEETRTSILSQRKNNDRRQQELELFIEGVHERIKKNKDRIGRVTLEHYAYIFYTNWQGLTF